MNKPQVIALEEHYFDAEVTKHFPPGGGPEARLPALRERLFDVGELRLKEMDEAGIDVQVLSHGAPATQRMDAQTAIPVARKANDRLFEITRGSNGRFHGFAGAPLRARTDRVMEQFGLMEHAGRKVQDLSGGFRRRVQVAKVLMVDTPMRTPPRYTCSSCCGRLTTITTSPAGERSGAHS